jgi:hypothetical protein
MASRDGERMFPAPPRPVEMTFAQKVSAIEGASERSAYILKRAHWDEVPAAGVRIVFRARAIDGVPRRRADVTRTAAAT